MASSTVVVGRCLVLNKMWYSVEEVDFVDYVGHAVEITTADDVTRMVKALEVLPTF